MTSDTRQLFNLQELFFYNRQGYFTSQACKGHVLPLLYCVKRAGELSGIQLWDCRDSPAALGASQNPPALLTILA